MVKEFVTLLPYSLVYVRHDSHILALLFTVPILKKHQGNLIDSVIEQGCIFSHYL